MIPLETEEGHEQAGGEPAREHGDARAHPEAPTDWRERAARCKGAEQVDPRGIGRIHEILTGPVPEVGSGDDPRKQGQRAEEQAIAGWVGQQQMQRDDSAEPGDERAGEPGQRSQWPPRRRNSLVIKMAS
jgi:hypothetical protein